MRTIVVASPKGGVGKTTLSTGLAVEASREAEKVAVIDLDPMLSTDRWFELRGETAGPTLITDVADIGEAVRLLSNDGWDYLFVDTAPAPLSMMREAIVCAHLTLVPCRASPVDVESSDLAAELATRAKVPFAFVMNGVPEGSALVEGAIRYLRTRGTVLEARIGYSEDYAEAMISGRTGGETGSNGELTTLWTEIREFLARTGPQKAKR